MLFKHQLRWSWVFSPFILLIMLLLLSCSVMSLCDPIDCSPARSSVHGIFQARIVEWVAISFSTGSSQSRDWTWVSQAVGRHFAIWATREDPFLLRVSKTEICSSPPDSCCELCVFMFIPDPRRVLYTLFWTLTFSPSTYSTSWRWIQVKSV